MDPADINDITNIFFFSDFLLPPQSAHAPSEIFCRNGGNHPDGPTADNFGHKYISDTSMDIFIYAGLQEI
jgi:hypothetical protein